MNPFDTPRRIATNGIELTVYEQGPESGKPIVLCHGFPEIAYSWRHQMETLSQDFRVVAVDQRGYNKSDKPSGVPSYAMSLLVSDIAAVIKDCGQTKATIVGHDWGGGVVWRMPLLYPERVAGVVGVNTPFGRPPGPRPPIEMLREMRGENNYVVSFQEPYEADEVLAADVDKAFRFFRRAIDFNMKFHGGFP